MSKHKRPKTPFLPPKDMLPPSESAVMLYHALRADGIRISRDGTRLQLAFPDLTGGSTDPNVLAKVDQWKAHYRQLVEERWAGLFEIVTAIETRNRIIFNWLLSPPPADGMTYATEVVSEPEGALETFLGASTPAANSEDS